MERPSQEVYPGMPRSRDGRWDRECQRPGCSVVFSPSRAKQVYCSRECSDEDRGNWARPVGGTHAVSGLEPRICPNPDCPRGGELFQPSRRNQLACSRSCRDKLPEQREKQRILDQHPERRDRANELRRIEEGDDARAAHIRTKTRQYNLARNGWTVAEHDAKLLAQEGKCRICGSHPKPDGVKAASRLHADHDHATGRKRDLLCNDCNVGLGKFKDDPVLLRAAAEYIEHHRAVTS